MRQTVSRNYISDTLSFVSGSTISIYAQYVVLHLLFMNTTSRHQWNMTSRISFSIFSLVLTLLCSISSGNF